MLSLHNFKRVLQSSIQQSNAEARDPAAMIGVNCFFINKNITEAGTLDPFTHVYMFDIGFPPSLMEALSDIFNQSCSAYLVCYHPPAIMITHYEFNVNLLCTQITTMHGSGEIHTGYIYRQSNTTNDHNINSNCDPMFHESWTHINSGVNDLHDIVTSKLNKELNAPWSRRH